MSNQETLNQIRRKVAIPSNILFVILVIAVEAMMFGGLISAHLVNTINFTQSGLPWPPPGTPLLPIEVTTVNTIILLISAVTVVLAVKASKREQKSQLRIWVAITFFLGLTFVSIQGYEWYNLINNGLSLRAGSSVKLKEKLPVYVEANVKFGNGLEYKLEKKELHFNNTGYAFNEKIKAAYGDWSSDSAYQKALEDLLTSSKGRGIHEVIVTSLDKLPNEVIINSLRGKIEYFEDSKVIRWVGLLSEDIRDQLLSFSKNEEYEFAVYKLYNNTQSNFGSYFYTIIGMHAFHVVAGLIVLFVLLISVIKKNHGDNLYNFVSATRIYWFFVVFLWPFLYYFVFLFKPVVSITGN